MGEAPGRTAEEHREEAQATRTDGPTEIDLDGEPVAERDDELPVVGLDAPPVDGADDDIPVLDLDAEGDAHDLVAELIAKAAATAERQDGLEESEPPLIDLDLAELSESEVSAEVSPAVDMDETAVVGGEATTPADRLPFERPSRATAASGAKDGDAEGSARRASDEEAGEEAGEDARRRLVELGPVSSPEARDRLLAEALAHAEHKEARYRVPFSRASAVGRWKALAASVILLLSGLIAVVPPRWSRPEPPAQLSTGERARGLRVALLLQAEQVEAFRVREQRLPATLDEVERTLPEVRYVRSGSRAYQLIAYQRDGTAIVYDSASPAAAFDALDLGWRPAEAAP